MPGQTTTIKLPYPLGSDGPDGPGAVSALANAVDPYLGVHLLIATRVSGGTINRGSFQDIAWEQTQVNAGVLQSNLTDMKLPWDGVYEIEGRFAVAVDLSSTQRLMMRSYVPSGGYETWGGDPGQTQNLPILFRDTFVGAANALVRMSAFIDGTGTTTISTAAPSIPKVSLRYLGKVVNP